MVRLALPRDRSGGGRGLVTGAPGVVTSLQQDGVPVGDHRKLVLFVGAERLLARTNTARTSVITVVLLPLARGRIVALPSVGTCIVTEEVSEGLPIRQVSPADLRLVRTVCVRE